MPKRNTQRKVETSAATMADNNDRATSFIDQLMSHVDEIVDAAQKEEWSKVRRMSVSVARDSRKNGCPTVSESARRLHKATMRLDNQLELKRSVIKLIGAVGREKPVE